MEAEGIVSVVMGSARDVVEGVAIPRFVFADFPLGNPVGKPWDITMQTATVELALTLAESAFSPRTTVQTPFSWADDDGWRDRYMQITDPEALAAEGERRRVRQAGEKAAGNTRT